MLEVGRGLIGLARFVRTPVVSCDVRPPGATGDREDFVRASGTSLPFRDSAFPLTVAVDVLEHFPRERRHLLVQELFRVTRDMCVIALPYGPAAARGEESYRRFVSRFLRPSNPWLEEHRTFGLPALGDLNAELPDGWTRTSRGNVNVRLWWAMRVLSDLVDPRLGLVLLPLALGRPFGETYRTIFVFRRSA